MIADWKITGDTHGDMSRFIDLEYNKDPNLLGIIILGDAGCNYYKNKKDHKTKMELENTGYNYYLVRGNHEERPENIEGMQSIYDENVSGDVFVEPAYPHIHYLKDGGIYNIDNHKTLVIGGAYSIDKFYRLSNNWMWFPQEQLTTDEMANIKTNVLGQNFDLILTHTCPYEWEPKDLFLHGVNQSTVDKSMELWLNEIKECTKWKIWLFGHYHADRLERPGVEMLFKYIQNLDDIWSRWNSDKELDWWIQKSPMYYI